MPWRPRRRVRPALMCLAIFGVASALMFIDPDDPPHHPGLLPVITVACTLMCLYQGMVEPGRPSAARLAVLFLPIGAIVSVIVLASMSRDDPYLQGWIAGTALALMVVVAEITIFLQRHR